MHLFKNTINMTINKSLLVDINYNKVFISTSYTAVWPVVLRYYLIDIKTKLLVSLLPKFWNSYSSHSILPFLVVMISFHLFVASSSAYLN